MLARANSNTTQQTSSDNANSSQFEQSTVQNIERIMQKLEYMRQANGKIIEESTVLLMKAYNPPLVVYNSPEEYPKDFLQPRANT